MTGSTGGTEPSTTRIGGGSARGTAVGVALVLAVVVWLGASGRPAPPAAAPSPVPPAATAVSAAEQPASPRASLRVRQSGSPAPSRFPAAQGALPGPPGSDAIAVIVHAAGMARPYLQLLREVSPGRLETDVVMNDPRPPVDARFQLAQLWTREEGAPFVMLESFPLPIEALLGSASSDTLIQVTSPARRDRADLPRLMRQGYRLDVRVERIDTGPLLRVSVSVGGPLPARELGDDGLIGDPGEAEGGATR